MVRFTLAAVSMTRRVVVLPLGVAALLSLPCLIIVRLGILVLSESAYFTSAAMRVPMSLQ